MKTENLKSLPNNFSAKGLRFALVVSGFHRSIALKLEAGARQFLQKRGASLRDIHVFQAPGSLEIPLLLKRLARSKRYNALVALGVVIKGETAHFEIVAGEAARGIAQVAYDFEIPVGNGVLTTYTVRQALERAGGRHGNKGEEAAAAALEMIFRLRIK
ncbi:MAG: 6,7-dimethyl-8-ribityllumazine synthase [Deltaproteobacteria bacterium]|nr:6,7-dimethyl-8-ribityllumazine synthase [Deltaproteobacteria bacterium]